MNADETRPEEFTQKKKNTHKEIPGWGVDMNPENDPTYPMRKRSKEIPGGYSWERPEQQPENIEVLRSVERPNVTAVFGTAVPPSGLSGVIRRLAFKYSESSYGRWVPLIMADRINELEGLLEDFRKGIIPNIFSEKGWKAEWRYNRKPFLLKAAVSAAAAAGILYYLTRSGKRS